MGPARTVGPTECRRNSNAGDHAEVAAAAPQRPEQVGVLVLGRPQQFAVGRHDIDGEEVVDREAVLAHQPADATAEVARHTGVAHDFAVVARPCACVSWSTSPHSAPPGTQALRSAGSTRTARIAERSTTILSSQTAVPATLSSAPYGDLQIVVAGDARPRPRRRSRCIGRSGAGAGRWHRSRLHGRCRSRRGRH